MTPASRSETMGVAAPLWLIIRLQDLPDGFLQQFIRPRWHAQWAQFPVFLWDMRPSGRSPSVSLAAECFDDLANFLHSHAVHCFFRDARGHGACVAINLPIRF